MKRLTSSMNGKLVLLTSVFVLGFLIFGTLAWTTLNTAKVHGPHYNRVVQNKDLLADVLPPPNYIVETYLTSHLIANETHQESVNGLIEHIAALKAEYDDRQNHWRENLADGDLKNEINQISRVPAERFFQILEEDFIPAVQDNQMDAAREILLGVLPEQYAEHRASVDRIVATTIQNAEDTEAEVAELIGTRQTIMFSVGIALAIAVISFAYWLSLSVRRQEREVARISSMVEQSPSNILFVDQDFVIRYQNASSKQAISQLQVHLSPEEVLGKGAKVIFGNKDLPNSKSDLPTQRTIEVGSDSVELMISPIVDDANNYLGAMISWEIITEKLELERQIRERADEERRQAEESERLAKETQRRVDVVLQLVNQLAEGRFDLDVPSLGSDAIGQVANALGQAVSSVRDALSEVREVSTTVGTASTEMTSAAEEISRSAQQQAARLEETAASLEEITATVKQNSDNAQEARALANGSSEIATAGGEVVGNAVQAMSEINESSKRIADIITTIDEIAFQTNLLALNAAVEAARAGEQGRGFAVVATEVRNLAQRSASSAKEIKTLIQDSNSKVERGTKLVNQSGETLEEIVNSVKRVTDIVAEIAAASQEQLTGIEQVTTAVSQMDHITQSNANQTEELAGTSARLLGHSKRLTKMVSDFELGDSESSTFSSVDADPVVEPDNQDASQWEGEVETEEQEENAFMDF